MPGPDPLSAKMARLRGVTSLDEVLEIVNREILPALDELRQKYNIHDHPDCCFYITIQYENGDHFITTLPQRTILRFAGEGVESVVDIPAEDVTVVTIPAGGGGGGLSVAGGGLTESPAGTVNVGAPGDASIVVNADDIQVAAGIQAGAALGLTAVQPSRMLTAGAGMTGGGDLSADRTFDVVANADASIVVNPNDIQVAAAIQSGAAAGATAVQPARQIIAGSGLTGGGDLSADRTLNVGAHADGSIAVAADTVQVGVLATDAQHGVRGGGTQHAAVSNTAAGFAAAITGANLVLQSNGAGTAATWVAPGAASWIMSTVEVDLGSTPVESGRFTIAGAGMTPGKPVLITKANGPYTGKGTMADEAEMDQINFSGEVLDATTIEAFWQSTLPVIGNFKLNYVVSG